MKFAWPQAVLSKLSTDIKYIAVVKGAREVTLAGTADLAYWRDRLKGEGLYPVLDQDGRARLLISAVESKWMGVKFRELSVSVFVCEEEARPSPDGVYLAAAFNSSRFFAWCERAMLQTPYQHGQIEVESGVRGSFELLDGHDAVLHAEQSADVSAVRKSDIVWDAKIYLPASHKLFYARLSGLTETYPFSRSSDVLKLTRSRRYPIIECLIDSHFAPSEWQVRRCATHARSKTVDRNQ